MRVKVKNKIRPIETYLIVHMFTFGIILLLPSKTFSNEIYVSMSRVAKEEIWGVMFLLVSFFQFMAMYFDSKRMKILSLSLSTFLWSSVGTMFFIESILHGYVNTGVSYLVIATFSLWLAYKIGGQRDGRHK